MSDTSTPPHSHDSLEATLDALPEAALLLDAGGAVRYVNPSAQVRWGTPGFCGSQLSAHPDFSALFSQSGNISQPSEGPIDRALRHAEPTRDIQLLLQRPGAPDESMMLSTTPLLLEGRVDGVVVVLQAPGAHRRADAELAERNRTLQALNALAGRLLQIDTVAEIYDAALDGILGIVGAKRGAVAVTDEARREFHLVADRSYNETTRRHTDHLAYGTPAAHNQARETGEIVVIHPDTAAAVGQTVLAAQHAGTGVLLPLVRGNAVCGVLSYLLDEYRDITGHEGELLRTAATFVGAALERAALYEAAETERRRLAQILDQMPVGVFLARGNTGDRTIEWSFVNGTAREQTATHQASPVVPRPDLQALHPDGSPFTADEMPLEQTLWTNRPSPPQEVIFRYPDGHERVFLSSATPLPASGDRPEAVVVTQEITQRKQLEDQVRSHAAAVQAEYERLAALVSQVDIALAEFDLEGRICLANETWLRTNGFTREAILGQRFAEISPDELAARADAAIDRVMASGEPMVVREFTSPVKPGIPTTFVDWSILPVRGPDGTITGALSATVDVTEKVRARQEAEAQRNLLQTVFDGAPVGLALFDREMCCLQLNQAYATIEGLDQQSAQGRRLYDLVPHAESRRSYHERAQQGEPVDLENAAVQYPDGQLRYFDFRYRPMRDAAGAVIGLLVVVTDVTARRALDLQKDEFIALASHELKTPVTTIKGYAQSGLRHAATSGDARLNRTLTIVNEQADRLARLINELLDVSRAQSGGLPLHLEEFDLGYCVREAITNLQMTAVDFTIAVDLAPDPTPVRADQQRIEQVVANLIQNAIKYSDTARTVAVHLSQDGREAVVAVQDFGAGIPLEQQAHVFERFFRADNVRDQHGGLGLGLFISHSIITRLGGRIWLESQEGVGSTFYFALPLAGPAA